MEASNVNISITMVYTIKLNQCVAGYHVYGIYTMHLCLRQLLLKTQSQHILYLYIYGNYSIKQINVELYM